MTKATLVKSAFAVLALTTAAGCGSVSAPFDKMKDQPMTVYRLQNYEPQTPAPTATTPAAVPGLPPQLQQWAAQAAQLLPPGLIPPGLIPGAAAPAAAPPPNVPRFHDFRILAYQAINDSSSRSDIVDLFGHESNFSDKYENCFFPEFGFALAQPNGPPADILVSLSCSQVKAFNINWPYSKIGLPPDTQKKIAAIVSKAFGS